MERKYESNGRPSVTSLTTIKQVPDKASGRSTVFNKIMIVVVYCYSVLKMEYIPTDASKQ